MKAVGANMVYTDRRLGSSLPVFEKIFLAAVFLLAFMPMPTVQNNLKFLAPSLATFFIVVVLFWIVSARIPVGYSWYKFKSLYLVYGGITLLYGLQIAYLGQWEEFERLLSKVLSFGFLICLTLAITHSRLGVKKIFQAIFYSSLVLSLFAIFQGFTGLPLMGEVAPARTYGFTIPFYKATPIMRSYGELGIFLTASWSYWLVFGKEFSFFKRWFYGGLVLLFILITQSRSTYLATLILTSAYFIILFYLNRKIIITIIFTVLFLPLIIDMVPRNFFVVEAVVGEGIYEKNVNSRFEGYKKAVTYLFDHPVQIVLGIDHQGWYEMIQESYTEAILDEHGLRWKKITENPTALHNRFLSNLLYLGIIAGTLDILILLIPMPRIALKIRDPAYMLMFLAFCGMTTCLHFYEGFFSLISLVVIASLWYAWKMDIKTVSIRRAG